MLNVHPPSYEEVDHVDIQNTLSRNVVVSLFTNILYLVTRLFIPPFILSYVSLEEYGIWSICFILISYLGVSVIGVTNVYIRYVAVFAAKGEFKKINQLVSTGLISVSLLCLLLIPIMWFGLPFVFEPLHISPNLYQIAFFLIFGTMLIFMADLSVGVFGYILQSLQKIVQERIIWTISYMLETVLIVLFLVSGYGIYGLLYAFLLRVISAVVLYTIACFRALPELSISVSYFDRKMLKLFFHFGGIVQISGLLGILNRSLEKIIAGFFIGVEATGLYEVGEKFPVMALMLPGSINAVLLPTTAHLHAKELKSKIIQIYVKGSRLINILTGLMMGFMAPFASAIIIAWLGPKPEYQIAASILAWFTIAYQMDVLTGPASAIYRSINKPGQELIYGVLQLLLVVVGTATGFLFFGYTIMAINIAVASMKVISALIYISYSNRYFKVSEIEFFFKVYFPGLVPYIFGYGLAWLSSQWFLEVKDNRIDTLFYLLFVWIAYVLTIPAFLYAFFCQEDEQRSIRKQLMHTLKELCGRLKFKL